MNIGQTEKSKVSRGLRNNNPGNIRRSAAQYRGERPSDDKQFKRFVAAAWGYRAMFMLLHTYRVRYGLNTVSGMIARYAPPAENHTGRYAACVCRWAGIGLQEPLDTLAREDMVPVVAAMSRMENGVPAVMEDVSRGWELFMADTDQP